MWLKIINYYIAHHACSNEAHEQIIVPLFLQLAVFKMVKTTKQY